MDHVDHEIRAEMDGLKTTRGRAVAITAGAVVLVIGAMLPWPTYWDYVLFLQEYDSLGRNPQGHREYRHEETGIVFVSLPGGTFLMGSREDEDGYSEPDGPVHEVTLSSFMIAKYEVSQAQWEAVMGVGSNPSEFKGENLPVDSVSWDELHTSGGFLYRKGFSLPSEAQWEYACRAGTTGDVDRIPGL